MAKPLSDEPQVELAIALHPHVRNSDRFSMLYPKGEAYVGIARITAEALRQAGYEVQGIVTRQRVEDL